MLKMELIFDDDKMQFYPTYEDLEELVLFVTDQITHSLQNVPTVQSWLAGGSTTVNTDAHVADHIVVAAQAKLKEAVKRNFEDPQAHLQWYSKYRLQFNLRIIITSSSASFPWSSVLVKSPIEIRTGCHYDNAWML